MAGRIKGITIEIGGNTTKLQKSLSGVDGKLKKTQQSLRDVNKLLKLNPGNITLLKQKESMLNSEIAETKSRLEQLKNAQKQMSASGVSVTSAQYQALQREIIETTGKLKIAQSQLKAFGSVGVQKANAVGNAFVAAGGKIASVGMGITSSVGVWGAAAIFSGKKLIDMSEAQTQQENKLIEIYKKRMGATKGAAKSTMELASAIQKEGVIGDEVTLSGAQMLATYAKTPSTVNALLPAMDNLLVQQKGLNATQEDATNIAKLFGKVMTGQTGALKKAGITFTDAQEEVLKYGTEEEKTAVLAKVVTENVGDMNSVFAETDAGKIQQAKNNLGDIGERVGAVILPAVANLANAFSDKVLPNIERVVAVFEKNKGLAEFGMKLAIVAAAAGPLAIMVGKVVGSIGTLMRVVPMVTGALNPPLLIGAGIAALLITLWKTSDTFRNSVIAAGTQIKTSLMTLWSTVKPIITQVGQIALPLIKQNLQTLGSALGVLIPIVAKLVTYSINRITRIISSITTVYSAIKAMASKVYNTLATPFTKVWNKVSEIIDKIKNGFKKMKISFPKIPKLHLTWGSKSKEGKNGPKISIPIPHLKWYRSAMDNGTILKKATVFGASGGSLLGAGEAGPEVVVGANSLGNMIASSVNSAIGGMAGTIAQAVQVGLSGQSAAAVGGSINVTVELGGQKVGRTIVDMYDTYKKRIG